ncbi:MULTISPECIES: hypothetical protein [unclassified Bacillus (in: firmicutes)]|nr:MULTISPECIES: hypothetical protein [unclassified Bacillus (in: firmicutes)]
MQIVKFTVLSAIVLLSVLNIDNVNTLQKSKNIIVQYQHGNTGG